MDVSMKLVALHKHWCIADAVRVVIGSPTMKEEQEEEAVKRFGLEYAMLGTRASLIARITVWYSLLYVVIEGYQELKQPFEPLDELLSKTEFVSLLRRFRNGTFHYQQTP